EEEAEWVGLSVKEALAKLREQETPPQPLKDIFMAELAQKLQGRLLSKLNPFTTKPREAEDKKS
ncbi:hypothetical protein BaRGS_00008095, partial [Batillaria attramentaria]